jgi:hypothetical protein
MLFEVRMLRGQISCVTDGWNEFEWLHDVFLMTEIQSR